MVKYRKCQLIVVGPRNPRRLYDSNTQDGIRHRVEDTCVKDTHRIVFALCQQGGSLMHHIVVMKPQIVPEPQQQLQKASRSDTSGEGQRGNWHMALCATQCHCAVQRSAHSTPLPAHQSLATRDGCAASTGGCHHDNDQVAAGACGCCGAYRAAGRCVRYASHTTRQGCTHHTAARCHNGHAR
jgi:hypothetical protein